MKLIIRKKGKTEVDQRILDYAEEKFRKFEEMVLEPTTVEVELSDLYRQKTGDDNKRVDVTAVFPKEKNPFHLEEKTGDFRSAVDLAYERFEKHLLKYHDKVKVGSRFPKKYWVAKVFEETMGFPRRVWGEIRKRREKRIK